MAQPAGAGWGLTQLMQQLAQVRSAHANFTEQKTVQMLNAPLLSSGTLVFVAPDYISKTILAPARQNFVLDHGQITLTSGPENQTQHFSVQQDPRIGGLAEGIRATLAGDLPALQRFYMPSLSGSPSAWQLLLRPKDAQLASFVAWIAIRGAQNRIEEIDSSGGGGTSAMRVTEILDDAK